MDSSPRIKVSVVIPAYNEARYISQSLSHLAAQTLSKDLFDVTVVDNGSTDTTASVARSFAGQMQINVVHQSKSPISAARNLGAASSDGDIVAFLDADCLVDPHWLMDMLAVAPERGLWGAHYRIPDDASWVGRIWAQYQARELSGPVSFLPSCTMCLHRSDFNRVGGFPEDIQTSEDVEFSSRVRALGLPVLAFPQLAVIHLGTPRTLTHFYRQNRWHGRDVVPLFLANLPSTANAGVVALSLYTLTMFWLALFGVAVAALRGSWSVPAILFLLLLAAPLLLTLRKAVGLRSVRSLGPLFVLYTTYLFARAAAVTHVLSTRTVTGHRRTA